MRIGSGSLPSWERYKLPNQCRVTIAIVKALDSNLYVLHLYPVVSASPDWSQTWKIPRWLKHAVQCGKFSWFTSLQSISRTTVFEPHAARSVMGVQHWKPHRPRPPTHPIYIPQGLRALRRVTVPTYLSAIVRTEKCWRDAGDATLRKCPKFYFIHCLLA